MVVGSVSGVAEVVGVDVIGTTTSVVVVGASRGATVGSGSANSTLDVLGDGVAVVAVPAGNGAEVEAETPVVDVTDDVLTAGKSTESEPAGTLAADEAELDAELV